MTTRSEDRYTDVNGRPGFVYRPNSWRQVGAAKELNRLRQQNQKLADAINEFHEMLNDGRMKKFV